MPGTQVNLVSLLGMVCAEAFVTTEGEAVLQEAVLQEARGCDGEEKGMIMRVVTCGLSEEIWIGDPQSEADPIAVTVTKTGTEYVQLGITAAREIGVERVEIYARKHPDLGMALREEPR